MDNFNRYVDDALAYIILAVLLLMFVVVMFEQAEYSNRRMEALNFEPVKTIDCSPIEQE